MDGKSTLIQKLANKLAKPKKAQETATINTSPILDSSNSSVLPESQPVNLEGITLIWYDLRLDTTEDTKKTAQELREVNNYVIFYSDQVQCIDYIKSVNNEKIFLVISGKSSSDILQEIHELSQVDSIFIFCLKVNKYENLLQQYEKLVGIYCDRSILINSIKQNAELLQKQLDTFSFYDQHREKTTRDLSEESAAFLWFQLFKDVILRMSRDKLAKQELIQFCRQYYRGNQKEFSFIDEFERSYSSDKSIYWYTRPTFLYKLVNKALRTEDIEQLYIFRFFIADLSLNLAEKHKKIRKREKLVMLYRGLKLEIQELNVLKQHEGNLISTNGFLSTSRLKDVAIQFAKRPTKRTNVVTVLYEIECNINEVQSIIFADITKYSEFVTEEEVLFDLGSTFKIISINEDKILNLYVIKMQATDAGMQTAKAYIEVNRKDNEETSVIIMFGKLLVQMGKYDQALKYFKSLLNDPSREKDIARIYNEIGSAYMLKGELNEAYENFQCAYEMMMNVQPCRIKDSARPLTNMAGIFLQKGEYEKTLEFYFQALEIRQKFYDRNHIYIAISLNNIGNVYYKKENYVQALIYHQAALEIQQKHLPNDHLDIAASYNNIGLIYWKKNDFDLARNYYEKSLEIRKKLLLPDHNDIAQSLINIAHVLYDQGQFIDIALKYYSDALTIQKIHFNPNDHDDLVNRINEHSHLQNRAGVVHLSYSAQMCSFKRPEYTVMLCADE